MSAAASRPTPRRAPAAALALALALALPAGCRPRPAPPPPPPGPTIRDSGAVGARAFERMKELAGNWLAGELPVTFEVIEHGTAILQRGGPLVVWYPDGNTLAASVFAEAGYHVRMRSKRITEAPGGELTVELAAFDAGNIVPDEPTARALTLQIAPANDRVAQRWSFGESLDAPPRELVLTRTDAAAPPSPAPARKPPEAPPPATPPSPDA